MNVSEAVAAAVKEGYDVIAQNIREGRLAAKRFRDGKYNIREVPGDIEEMSLRVLGLARELAETSFDVCERLVKLVGTTAPSAAEGGVREAPAFRPHVTKAAPGAAPASDKMLKLTVRFSGDAKGRSHTHTLTRPTHPTAPRQISAAALALRGAEQVRIADVTFETDVAVEGLIAVISIPGGQPPGIYSGLVYAEHEPAPLGVLTIEVRE